MKLIFCVIKQIIPNLYKKSVIFQTELYICIRTIRIDYENCITIFILSFPTQLKKFIKGPSLKLIRKHFRNLILRFL